MGLVNAIESLYVALYLPEFPAQARLRLRPEMTRRPFAVLDGAAPLEVVCSTNKAAQALGVTRGITRIELDGFADLTAVRRSAAEEDAARKALLTLAGTFTPRVEVPPLHVTEGLPLVVVLDMTGTERMFGAPREAVQRVQKAVRSMGLVARCAASRNFDAAVCASAYAVRSPLLLEAGQERKLLGSLPLAALGLSPEQQNTFSLWGLRTVEELAQIPEDELVARLGQEGSRLSQRAHGRYAHFMVPEEPVFALEDKLEFETPEDRLDSLLFVLGPMLDHMLQQARAYSLALAELTVSLTLEGGAGEHVRSVKPTLPTENRQVLLQLLQLDLQEHPPAAAATAVHLHGKPGPRGKVQTELFSPPLPEPMRLEETLARVAALVGEDNVGRAKLLDTHRPDGFVLEPFSVPDTRVDAPRDPPRAQAALGLRRLRQAPPLRMTLVGKTPSAFAWKGKRYTVKQAYGPWPFSGDWWSETVWSCEDWDVCAVSASGEALLGVVRFDCLRSTWHLEALYD